jgi:lipid II:glycine glycyltransferase (peptidoglycan interpeptide bridge formation enzyme)
MARQTRAVFLRCSPGVVGDDERLGAALVRRGFVRLPDEWTLWNAPRVVMALDLRPGEAELKRAMRESTRRSLTRVQANGGRVDRDVSEAAVARLHRLLVAAGRRKNYPVRDLGFFQALRRQYLGDDRGYLALACHGDRDLAGVLAVRFGRRAHLLYAAIDGDSEPARTLRAGTAVHWALIRWAKAAGCEALDWGASGTGFPPRPESNGYGIYEFKRGFGCSIVHLSGYYDLVFRPGLYRAFRWMETRCAPALWRLRARFNT